MKDQIAGLIGFTVILGVGVMIGITSAMVTDTKLQQDAIERGFAEYNSTNGNWQWKERTAILNVVTVTNQVECGHLGVITNTWPLYHWTTTNQVNLGAGE